MMNGNIKLTQADGNAMFLEPYVIQIVETVSVEDNPDAKSGVWMMLEDGLCSSAVLKDSFGWVLNKLDQNRPRVQLTSSSGGKISIPTDIIKRMMETGSMTVIHTSLSTNAGALRVGVMEKVDEIMDLVGVGDEEEEPEVVPTPLKTRRRKPVASAT